MARRYRAQDAARQRERLSAGWRFVGLTLIGPLSMARRLTQEQVLVLETAQELQALEQDLRYP
jgi:hypothetical protein